MPKPDLQQLSEKYLLPINSNLSVPVNFTTKDDD